MQNQIVEVISNPGIIMVFDPESGNMIREGEYGLWKGVFWKDVYTVADLQEYLWQAVIHDVYLGVCYHEGRFSLYNPDDKVYALFFGPVELLKPAAKNRLPQIRIGDLVCTTIGNYMEQYDSPDDFFYRNQMVTRIKQWAQGEAADQKNLKLEFNPDKVINLKAWTNHFHKPSVVLEYRGIPPVFGLSKIREVFPHIGDRELKRLYNRFGVSLPRKLQ